MILLAGAPQQRLVGRVLDQRMLEDVPGARRPPALIEQLGLDQLAEPVAQRRLARPSTRPAASRRRTRGPAPRPAAPPRAPAAGGRAAPSATPAAWPECDRRQRPGERRSGRPSSRRMSEVEHRLGQLLDVERARRRSWRRCARPPPPAAPCRPPAGRPGPRSAAARAG